MTMKNDAKFEVEMTCHFKTDMRNLTNFDSSTQKSENYVMFQLKKYRGVVLDSTQDWYKVQRKTGLYFPKLTWGIWQIFTRALENLQIGTLMASFWLKLKVYELKIYKGVMCLDSEEWCKNWRGINLSVQNWHEEFDEFRLEHLKI